MSLTGKQRRHLRALGHAMAPVAHIGKDGLSEPFVLAVSQALTDHELIKVKLLEAAALDRHEAAEDLATRTQSQVAQVLGNTILLYRRNDDDPVIELP
ncbi:MAG: ribosome assembly RNA-binding protein YhbY [Kofleriaceae bacterium]|nr:ribosome assembly RNA-binding protein YhbY [Myxococcales bacterium]MCB9561318.1 ribosome assembly RNA-binding protein YhbY [Kofleriaceae bacterium]MCB9574373.1 ribosome assembly RNA-binding protein YhbY [Kofleriaceae bacterium]